MYYKELNRTLRDLCLDALLAHPLQAISIPLQKFRVAADSWSAYQFSGQALLRNQIDAYTADTWIFNFLGKGLTGAPLDEPAMRAFITAHYLPAGVAWLTALQSAWNNATLWCRTPDRPLPRDRWVHDFAGGVPGGLRTMPGLPLFYPVALLGMLAAMIASHPARRLHLAWVPVMLLIWYAATFVGVTNARYRFAFEPFCFIYICLLADFLFRLPQQNPSPEKQPLKAATNPD
jgi:hypothetical protein